MSVGVAKLAEGEDGDAFMLRTDKALYEAKHAGRNCVVVARRRAGADTVRARPSPQGSRPARPAVSVLRTSRCAASPRPARSSPDRRNELDRGWRHRRGVTLASLARRINAACGPLRYLARYSEMSAIEG